VSQLPLSLLLVIFAVAAAAIWIAGIPLAVHTDVLSTRWNLGAALGGLILLAFATNLPEIAIVMTAAQSGDIGLATGNILGGIAIQTVLLVVVVTERSGDAIADAIGLSGAVFGATVLALATALPAISTGLTAVRNEDYQLAVSDVFGGNAFLPVLFLPAVLLSGQAVLPQVRPTDLYLTALGILLTLVYGAGLLLRPRRRIARMGIDSLVALILYAIGVAGLFFIPGALT
jgi:cation:H+ antiporter